jgi:hypothetical protein
MYIVPLTAQAFQIWREWEEEANRLMKDMVQTESESGSENEGQS